MSVKAVNVHDDGERGKDAATALHVHRTHDDRWTLHDSQRNSCSKPYSKKSVSNNALKKKFTSFCIIGSSFIHLIRTDSNV